MNADGVEVPFCTCRLRHILCLIGSKRSCMTSHVARLLSSFLAHYSRILTSLLLGLGTEALPAQKANMWWWECPSKIQDGVGTPRMSSR